MMGIGLLLKLLRNNPNSFSFKSKGENVTMSKSAFIYNPENISIGSHVYIGDDCYIAGVGGVTIEDNVIFGPRVTIHSSNHRFEYAYALPYDGVSVKRPVHIEANVWVGGNSILLPGVRIGEGAVIGLGAVVTKDVPKCAVVGGNPAQVLKYRDIEHYEQLKVTGASYLRLKKENKMRNKYVFDHELSLIRADDILRDADKGELK